MRAAHLARRFVGALWPGRPRAVDEEWVARVLLPGELALWRRMPRHDRRHSIRVARAVQAALAGTVHDEDSRWLAAALLHDVGKLDAGLGVYGRVVATLAGGAAGHEMADAWSARRGFTRRVGLYLRHGELGADMIRLAGGREEAARWAAAHHDRASWTATAIPSEVVAVLDAADDD
ncbi:MAG: HD domain-containing protein [Acidimicrobiia bacterium]|nr:HD domain-containing protein [Acidimicrobiia bacterium]